MNAKIFLAAGIIVVIAAGAVLFLRDGGERIDTSEDSSGGLIIGNNAIYAAAQVPSYAVAVTVVRFEKPGFVVIHDNTAAGAPGGILGVSGLLPAGETENPLPITLSRAMRDGETLYAMLHLDNGDGQFGAASDAPALDSVGGAPTMMAITVSADAAEPGIASH